MIKKSLRLLVIFSLSALSACANEVLTTECSQLVIKDAWIREAPPGISVLAGYMRIKNTTEKMVTITSAASPEFDRIEFHQAIQTSNSMKMQALPVLKIAAKSELLLEPEGRHMMLINPAKDFKDGDSLNIELLCTSQENANVEFLVKKTTGNDLTTHQHQHH